MRIPCTINENTKKTYEPSEEILSLEREINRRLRAENFSWDNDLCPSLLTYCIQSLVQDFKNRPLLNELPLPDQDYLMETLPTNLPLEITVPLIPEDIYWKRSYNERWEHQIFYMRLKLSWKVLFLERYIQDFLENAQPEYYNDEEMSNFFKLVCPYIQRLRLRQLQQIKCLPTVEPHVDDVFKDHINFSKVLEDLKNINEIDLIFGPRNIATKFKHSLFDLTVADCANLGKGILKLEFIKILRIHRSSFNDGHMKALIQSLVSNKTLIEIDFSHCKIGCTGAKILANLIIVHPALETLKLCNNLIGVEGMKGITYALQLKNICPLRHLDLRFNPLGDDGMYILCSALIRNDTKPSELILSGVGFTENMAVHLGEIISMNKSLRVLNISNNVCKEMGGKAIVNGLKENTFILRMDIRNCFISPSEVRVIRKCLNRNKYMDLKKPWCGDVDEISLEEEVSSQIPDVNIEEAVVEEDTNVDD